MSNENLKIIGCISSCTPNEQMVQYVLQIINMGSIHIHPIYFQDHKCVLSLKTNNNIHCHTHHYVIIATGSNLLIWGTHIHTSISPSPTTDYTFVSFLFIAQSKHSGLLLS